MSCSARIFVQDHAFAGIGAGTLAVFCMKTFDLLKVKFQLRRATEGGIVRTLCNIHACEGYIAG